MSLSPLLADSHFNIGPLHEMVNGDTTSLNNLLTIFIKDAEATTSTLSYAISRGDYRAIKELAHGLKGICSVLEMREIQESAITIEALALEKNDLGSIQKLFDDIEHILKNVIQKLRLYLDGG